jgi:hypothetical protein
MGGVQNSLGVSRHYRADIGQHKLVSSERFEPGQPISSFGARERLAAPTYLTVQVSELEHILLEPEILEYINHSCDPNVFFDTEAMKLVSLAHIEVGDELTFFYPSTEWAMAQGFLCHCGAERCLGVIEGASRISIGTLSRFRLTPHVERLLAERERDGKRRPAVARAQSMPT